MKSLKQELRKYAPPRLLWAWQSWRYEKFGEPELLLVPRMAGTGVGVDVGAANGMYTRALSRVSSMVYAYEANPKVAAWLARVAPKNVKIVPKAVSDCTGISRLTIPSDASSSGLGTLEAGVLNDTAVTTVAVPCCRLDDERLGSVSFVKIDVEGHEHKVLLGSVGLIRECRPTFLVELEERHRRGSIEQAIRFFADFRYAGYFQRRGVLHSISEFSLERDQDLRQYENGNYINNFFFLPSEAKNRIAVHL